MKNSLWVQNMMRFLNGHLLAECKQVICQFMMLVLLPTLTTQGGRITDEADEEDASSEFDDLRNMIDVMQGSRKPVRFVISN